jgi:hypothetical protein
VMGEFFLEDGPFDAATPSFATVVGSWYDAGYAGAWAWDYYAACVAQPGTAGLDMTLIADFAADPSRACMVTY